jgi:class 3 adenylate cyclase
MQKAKDESDRLLLNILPQETADELRRFGQTTAKRFDHVSVLFCDIVDFTKLSENLSPEDLVADLDLYFKAFDEMSMRNGLEKIKTVGDAYLSAGGIPENNTATAVDVINTALEMQDFVKELEAKRREESRSFYQIRIGVHSGPVVAGVVGLRKFQFDIWGDTVNIAARMQQSSEPGKINISQVTHDLVKDHFKCTSRGAMIAKNKGQMEMYYVDSKVIKL